MAREKLELLDNIYLRACNLALDYGGLALSVAGGAAITDYNSEILGDSARSTLVGAGLIGIPVAPGLDVLIGSGTMLDSPSQGDNTLYNDYIGSQVGRNLFAYFGAWQLAEGIRNNSPINAATGLLICSFAAVSHIIGRKAKRELEARLRKRAVLPTQPVF